MILFVLGLLLLLSTSHDHGWFIICLYVQLCGQLRCPLIEISFIFFVSIKENGPYMFGQTRQKRAEYGETPARSRTSVSSSGYGQWEIIQGGEYVDANAPLSLLVIESAGGVTELIRSEFDADEVTIHSLPQNDIDDVSLLHVNPEAVVLHLQNGRGIDLCRSIWSRMGIPIFVVIDEPTEIQQLEAFAAGAADVVSSASSGRILAARIWARMNVAKENRADVQQGNGQAHPQSPLVSGELSLNVKQRRVSFAGVDVPLTKIEFDILALLMSDPERVFSRQEIIRKIWNSDWAGDGHMLESHVSRLRKKVLVCGGPNIAVAVRGVGYRLCDSADVERSASSIISWDS
jgi:DNA-binding response OmpR family regulator